MAGMFSEADWEDLALDILLELDWQKLTGTDIAFGEPDGRPQRVRLMSPNPVRDPLWLLPPDPPGRASCHATV
jgi:hypothetical protein